MDFLNLFSFPGNVLQLDIDETSGLHGTATGQVGADTLAAEPSEQPTSKSLVNPSDSWHTYGGSGMVQPNLWEKHRPARSAELTQDVNKISNMSEGPTGPPVSIISFLSLEDVLAMEDHGHVPRIRERQVTELSALLAKAQCPQYLACDPGVRELLKNPQVINAFVQLYFEHYHPTLPLLHKATFNVDDTPPLLVLAVLTIGGRFSKIPQSHTLTSILGGILRKALDNLVYHPLSSESEQRRANSTPVR